MTDPWDREVLSPVECRAGRWYKREDLYAPLGPRSINGSKLRQLDYLIGRAYDAGAEGVVTGASVLSPQVSMAAIVARRYHLPCRIVLGGTRPDTAIRHPNVSIAVRAGARLEFTPVGYNPALQKAVATLADDLPGWYRLHYGITTPPESSAEDVAAFHAVGARQAANVPAAVRRLIMPFGSGNSATSMLWGLSELPDPPRVTLVGIGPSRWQWMLDRLNRIDPAILPRLRLGHVDLHAAGVVRYHDRVPYMIDDIVLHPTYEGKVAAWLGGRWRFGNRPREQWAWRDGAGDTMLWIVGSEASTLHTRAALDLLEVTGRA